MVVGLWIVSRYLKTSQLTHPILSMEKPLKRVSSFHGTRQSWLSYEFMCKFKCTYLPVKINFAGLFEL